MKTRKLISLTALFFIAVLLFCPLTAWAAEEDEMHINLQLNENVWQADWQLLEEKPPLIPLRELSVSTGANIIWEKETGLIYYFCGEKAVIVHPQLDYIYIVAKEEVEQSELEEAEISAKLDYQVIEYQKPIVIKNGVSYVSAAFLAYLGMEAFWDENFQYLDISLDPFTYATGKQGLSYYYASQLIVEDVALRLEEVPEKIASFTTYFNEKDVNRTINIKLAAAALDGVVVEKGSVLSFNQTVGPRTPERGYLEAIIFVDNNKILGYGGGVCQVSSTLYNTALNAGFEIEERYQHSLPVSYLPLGSEATVFYGKKDLKIRNCLNEDITIRCLVDHNSLTIEFWQ